MKKFYTDPRIVLLMIDWYGLKLAPRVFEKTMVMKECHGAGNAGKTKTYNETRQVTAKSITRDIAGGFTRKYYIHEDSLPIFKPHELDFGLSNKDVMYQFEDGKWLWANEEEPDENETVEIIHRNFKQFFTPQEEV